MILSTINLRGLGGSPKFSALRRLFLLLHPDLVLVQETMSEGHKACQLFLKLFPGWEVYAIDASGRSGGLLYIWNPLTCDLVPFIMPSSIVLVGHLKGIDEEVKILNLYGPYRDRMSFWDRLVGCGIL